MILCQCTGVTDATIKKLIENGASSVPEITRRCGAGRCCACCRAEIAALLGTAPSHADNPELGHFTNDSR
jgi:bacterioferritin-associated ferredoxin